MAGSRQDDDYWTNSTKKKSVFDDDYNEKESSGLDFSEAFNSDITDSRDDYGLKPEGAVSARYKTAISSIVQTSRKQVFSSHGDREENNLVQDGFPKFFSASREAKLESQVNELQRNLEECKSSRWTAWSVQETVKDMVLGEPFTLELYKSKEDKLALIDAAIRIGDGNAITAAVLHFKKTIKDTIFVQEMIQRSVAISQYLVYLRQMRNYTELADVYGMLNRTKDAALLTYDNACSTKHPESKIRNLKSCLRTHFEMDPSLSFETGLINEQISLLERQLPIEKADASLRKQEKTEIPSIVDAPLISTLFYSCLYHWGIGENHLASPMGIKKAFNLTDKQYMWPAFKARAQQRQWQHVNDILVVKTQGWMLASPKWVLTLNAKVCIEILQMNGADMDIYSRYIQYIDQLEERFDVAKKYKCHKIAVDTLVSMRDRLQLEKYKFTLSPSSSEYEYAAAALRAGSIKWKN